MAEAYFESKQIARAIPMYEEALRRKPRFWPALHKLGLALRSCKSFGTGAAFHASSMCCHLRGLRSASLRVARDQTLIEGTAQKKSPQPFPTTPD